MTTEPLPPIEVELVLAPDAPLVPAAKVVAGCPLSDALAMEPPAAPSPLRLNDPNQLALDLGANRRHALFCDFRAGLLAWPKGLT